jgi:RHS repeat-associated protein
MLSGRGGALHKAGDRISPSIHVRWPGLDDRLDEQLRAKTDGYSYDAFGSPTHSPGSSANPFQFTGQQTDVDSGLQYLRARYYDPSTGRFLGRDPAPTPMSSPMAGNPYAYVGNNPSSWVDPSGLWCPKDPSDCIPDLGDVWNWVKGRPQWVKEYVTDPYNVASWIQGGVGWVAGVPASWPRLGSVPPPVSCGSAYT